MGIKLAFTRKLIKSYHYLFYHLIKKISFSFLLFLCISPNITPFFSYNCNLNYQQNSLINSINTNPTIISEEKNEFYWSDSSVISQNDGKNSFSPNIALDSESNVHVVWYDYETTFSNIYYRKFYSANETWSPIKSISNQLLDINSRYPDIVIDSKDGVHVIWWEHNGSCVNLIYSNLLFNRWSEPEIITSSKEHKEAIIQVLENDDLIILYNNDNQVYLDLYYRIFQSKFNLWSIEYQLTNTSHYSLQPHLLAKENFLHLVWIDKGEIYSSSEVYYMKFSAFDSLPSNFTLISQDDMYAAIELDFIIDESNNVHIVWTESSANHLVVYYRYRFGNQWNEIIQLNSDKNSGSCPSICRDYSNNTHFIWVHNLLLYHKVLFESGTWSNSVKITTTKAFIFDPQIICDQKNKLHLIWNSFITNSWEIFYKSSIQYQPKVWILSIIISILYFCILFIIVIRIRKDNLD